MTNNVCALVTLETVECSRPIAPQDFVARLIWTVVGYPMFFRYAVGQLNMLSVVIFPQLSSAPIHHVVRPFFSFM